MKKEPEGERGENDKEVTNGGSLSQVEERSSRNLKVPDSEFPFKKKNGSK